MNVNAKKKQRNSYLANTCRQPNFVISIYTWELSVQRSAQINGHKEMFLWSAESFIHNTKIKPVIDTLCRQWLNSNHPSSYAYSAHTQIQKLRLIFSTFAKFSRQHNLVINPKKKKKKKKRMHKNLILDYSSLKSI